jgi:hypothetical protein
MNAERCRYFRNKSMCVSGMRPDHDGDEESGAAGYCWCNLTMREIGEDDRLVSAEDCSNPQRSCYQPY